MPGALLLKKVEAALQGGCRMVQLRNKNASYTELKQQAQQLLALCRQFQAQLFINDNLSLALDIGADGVHLGRDDIDIAAARCQCDKSFIIGATCHNSLSFARQAVDQGANYLAFGRFFSSTTKAGAPPATLTILAQAKQATNLPVVAIGGITVDNARTVIDNGADCVAVCHDLFHHRQLSVINERAMRFTQLFAS